MSKRAQELSPLVLVFTAAFYHPDARLRAELADAIEQWTMSLGPYYSREEIRTLLEKEKGTPLEPFILTPPDTGCASALIQALFSDRLQAARVRIVSRDTVGNQGGLIVTRKLASYYRERLARVRLSPRNGQYTTFVPGLLPEWGTQSENNLGLNTARITYTDDGLSIHLGWPVAEPKVPGHVARQLQKHSRISGSTDDLAKLGLRVECSDHGVEVRTGSTEALIRLMAHIENAGRLVLSAGPEDDWPETHIPLQLPEDKSTAVRAVRRAQARMCPWLRVDSDEDVPLNNAQRLAISRLLSPHGSWINALLPMLL